MTKTETRLDRRSRLLVGNEDVETLFEKGYRLVRVPPWCTDQPLNSVELDAAIHVGQRCVKALKRHGVTVCRA